MKFAASSYSFNRLLTNGTETQLSIIPIAKELGFDGIEFVDILPHDGSSKEEYAKKLRAECEKAGLEISNFTFSADFINGSDGDTEKEIERVKGMIDLAKILGAKSVRHDAAWDGGGESFEMVLPKLAGAVRRVTEYAETLGIKTTVENHGYFCQDALRVEKLYNAVNHRNFGLLCDMGNFMCADEDPAKSFGIAAPYASYVHAKDFHFKIAGAVNPGEGFFMTRSGNYLRGAILGHGDVPVINCLRALKRYNYDGFIAIEFEGMEDNIEALRIGLANLKKYVKYVSEE